MRRRSRPSWAIDPGGDRVLAAAASRQPAAWLLGTRRHLSVVPDPVDGQAASWVWPWEDVQAADWDQDAGRLTIREVGAFGRPRVGEAYLLEDAGLLLQLVRERVSASVVLQRQVPIVGRRGFRVIARRNPAGGPLHWMHEYDEGVDPNDPQVARLAEQALDAARAEVGDSI